MRIGRSPLLALLLACGAPLLAQAKPEASPEQALQAAPSTLEGISAAELEAYAKKLSADDFEGRMTATPGQEKAAECFEQHFKKLGLRPLGDKKGRRRGFYQAWPIDKRSYDAKATGLFAGSKKLHKYGAVFLPRALAKKKKVSVRGKLVFAGRGRIDYETLGGAIAVAQFTGGGAERFGEGNRLIASLRGLARDADAGGARACVLVAPALPIRFMSVVNQSSWYPGKPFVEMRGRSRRVMDPPRIPTLVLAGEDADAVLAGLGLTAESAYDPQFDLAIGKKSKKTYYFKASPKREETTARNVCAYLEGSHPKLKSEAIVFSCHMDHLGVACDGQVFNGADDNASGSATVLEISAAFARLEKHERPKRSVIFLVVSGEELGLFGSLWYSEHPTWPLKKIIANVNMDMLGRSTAKIPKDTVAITPTHRHAAYSTLARDAHFLGEALGLKLGNGDKFYRRSDHYNFAKKGVPVVFFSDDEHPDYHMPSDTVEKLDFPKMEKIARLAFLVGYRAANAPGRPKRLGSREAW